MHGHEYNYSGKLLVWIKLDRPDLWLHPWKDINMKEKVGDRVRRERDKDRDGGSRVVKERK